MTEQAMSRLRLKDLLSQDGITEGTPDYWYGVTDGFHMIKPLIAMNVAPSYRLRVGLT